MNSGYRTFAENFKECCGQSCARLAYEKNKSDIEYENVLKECDKLYEKIKAKLGDDRLINQFDATKNCLLGWGDEYLYQQGFQDCVYLLRWIGAL